MPDPIDVNEYDIYQRGGGGLIGTTALLLQASTPDPSVNTLWRYEPNASVRAPYSLPRAGSDTPNYIAYMEYPIPDDYVEGTGLEIILDVELGASSPATVIGGLNTLEVYAQTANGGPITEYIGAPYTAGVEVVEYHSSGTDLRQNLNNEGLARLNRTFVIPGRNRGEFAGSIHGYIANGSGGASSFLAANTRAYQAGDTITIVIGGYNSSNTLGQYVFTEIWGLAGEEPPPEPEPEPAQHRIHARIRYGAPRED
jgi:hypothetical protein